MAQGSSGRVVIDIDPELKREIYQHLRSRGSNMREWFLSMIQQEFTPASNDSGESQLPAHQQ